MVSDWQRLRLVPERKGNSIIGHESSPGNQQKHQCENELLHVRELVLFPCFGDRVSYVLAQKFVPRYVEMHIIGILQIFQMRRNRREQVVGHDAVLRHQLTRRLVAFDDGGGHLILGSVVRDGSRGGPNQLRSSLLHPLDELLQALALIGNRRIAIVDAKVEVDDIPFAVAQSDVDLVQTKRCRTAIGWSEVDVGFSSQRFAHAWRVTTRNRVPD